ncbi:MAG TPA: condensation domain-containing protein [Thermoanaerobaculia bacterium]|nr:condensation domain-containing protein [Thermoanaerobaculia bacterium]
MSGAGSGLDAIAIVGMAGRFPGAADVDELWRNLRDGRESITFFDDEELAAAGVPPELCRRPDYVRAAGALEGVELFDAGFFGLTPREAELMDPQQRLFLECCWQACEDAGYDPLSYPGKIGVYGGSGSPAYFVFHVLPNVDLTTGWVQVKLFNDKDFLTTQASYRLNLRGPSLAVQTACSTALVAVHLAGQALLDGECEMALAGGSTVNFPHRAGYLFEEGGIASPDGHCRAFDARARGTVPGSGAGVVLLKRLAEALADRDTIHAVILGSAVNNDGAGKAGFTAPGVESQIQAIGEALALAGVDPDRVGYVEAHGSGTPLGDPIEIEALTRAFRASTERRSFCAVGSVKSNFGHTSAAAGVAGLLKTVQALKHRQIPPSLHFEAPNPLLRLDESPFYVNARLRDWPANGAPRRAGVNSLGLGGTNAHVVLEEAPAATPGSESRPWQLLLLSARTGPALEAASARLAHWLRESPEADLADVAHTLRVGRHSFAHRRALVCRSREEAVAGLAQAAEGGVAPGSGRGVAFLLPGTGDHYLGMGAGVYREEPRFRDALDRCAEALRPHLGLDLRDVLHPAGGGAQGGARDLRRLLSGAVEDEDPASLRLGRTALLHPALFAVEYALAELWLEWGIRPWALLGYSLGEYVAACLAGVFSLEDALAVVAARARLVDALPAGVLLAVPLPEEELAPLLDGEPELSLSAANGPGLSVAGGPAEAVARLEQGLAGRGVSCRRLRTRHAFHSRMMEPAVGELERLLAGIRLAPPRIPFVSNATGTWITDAEATDPAYWARHLRRTVRFAQGVETLMAGAAGEPPLLLEVGPGQTLGTLAQQHPRRPAGLVTVASLPGRSRVGGPAEEPAQLLDALGRLWCAGAAPDWAGFTAREERRRVPLPTYPFERRRYFLDLPSVPAPAVATSPDPSIHPSPGLHARPELTAPWEEPQGGVETAIAGVWEEVLGVQGLGRHDNFFELSGNSLLAIQIVSRLSADLGTELSVATLLANPTIAALAERAGAAPGRAEAGTSVIPPRAERTPCPLSIDQERLWHIQQRDPASPIYNIYGASRLRGALEIPHLAAALAEVVRRHEALRTSFAIVDGEPVQEIAPQLPAGLPVVDLRGLPAGRRENEARQVADAVVREPFDLARPPLLRMPLVRVHDEDSVWVMAIHHLITDRISSEVRFQEIVELYQAFSAGLPSPLPEPPFQFADFAVWQRDRLRAGAFDESLAWWRSRLAGAPELLPLPTDRPRPPVPTGRGARRSVAVSKPRSEALRALAQREGVTLFVAGLAVWKALLVRLTGAERLIVGTPMDSRQDSGTRGVQGFFLNQLCLDSDLSGDPSFRTVLSRVHETAIGAYAHRDLPFTRLVQELLPEPDPSRFPFTQAVFLLIEPPPGGWAGIPGVDVEPYWVDAMRTQYDIMLAFNWIEGEGLVGFWEYSTDLFEEATIDRMAGQLQTVLDAVLDDPGLRLRDLPLLGAPQKRQIASLALGITEVEERLARLWGQILSTGEPGDGDDFFRLGGDSLLAARLASRVGEAFGLDVPPEWVFRRPGLGAQAKDLAEGALPASGAAAPLARLSMGGRTDFELSFAQQRLWVFDQLEPGSTAYNHTSAVRLTGRLDVPALERTLGEILRRHEVLRTRYTVANGDPVQRIEPAGPPSLPVVDLGALGEREREAEVRAVIRTEKLRLFDLSRGPMLRALLVRLDGESHALLFSLHHIASDIWSMALLVREVAALYGAFSAGRPSPLPELPVQYADFAAWQRQCLRGGVIERHLAFWERRLQGELPAIELPGARPQAGLPTYRGDQRAFRLAPELFCALRDASRREGATLFMTLVAGFAAWLSRATGQEDLLIGTTLGSRNRIELEDVIGFFVNILPLRIDLAGPLSFRQLLGRVKSGTAEMLAHQDLPLELLLGRLRSERLRRGQSLFQVTFGLNSVPLDGFRLPGLAWSPIELRDETARVDLSLWAVERPGGLEMVWTYRTDLFEASAVERMNGQLEQVLARIAADPDVEIGRLELLSAGEREGHDRERRERSELRTRRLLEIGQRRTGYPGEQRRIGA